MSGAWERERPSVLLAILTREIVTTKWALGFRTIALPAMSGISFRSGAPYDVMRNAACADALVAGFQWVMFLDDDVIPPADVFARLVRHDRDVVSGLYYRRQEPICPVAMKIDGQGAAQWVTSWSPPECVLDVDFVGAGCLLIHRRVLEAMPRPWFEWEIGKAEPATPRGRGAMSEDFVFCANARRAGFAIGLDTSIRCEHVGLGQSSSHDGSFRPSSLP